MVESSNNTSSRPSRPSQVLKETLREGSVNIEAHASISTPVLRSLHLRSAMEEAPEDFVGSLLRDSPEALPTTISQDLDDSQALLDVMSLRSRMGPPPDVPPS
ncbi:hypothetical protein LIER_19448 [Lithospermum erythrorhizon]|uniref:Uncharacterized protein n=1 Tax=Lithospermum erythrorhizon TaxID=34254 RepID=A0AAV3QKF0_LITER